MNYRATLHKAIPDIRSFLGKSVFYPASGLDLRDVIVFSGRTNCFVHADYTRTKQEVIDFMHNDFQILGYEFVKKEEFLFEEELLEMEGVMDYEYQGREKQRAYQKERANNRLKKFAIKAEFRQQQTKSIYGEEESFEILHLGGEATDIFQLLYMQYKVNPLAITICNPSEGSGDNWTEFTNPEYLLFKLIRQNSVRNATRMPGFLLTDPPPNNYSFWPGYHFTREISELVCSEFESDDI